MSYDSEVAADSPALYWKLQDTSGTTATDSSGNARHGTYNGTAATNYALNQSVSLLSSDASLKSVKFMRDSGTDGGFPTTEANLGDASTVGGKASVSIAYASWNGQNIAGSAFSTEQWIRVPSTLTRYASFRGFSELCSRGILTPPAQFLFRLVNANGSPQGFRYAAAASTAGGQSSYVSLGFVENEAGVEAMVSGADYEQSIEDSNYGVYDDWYDDSPHHVVVACGTASIRLYADGVLGASYFTSGVPAIPTNTSAPLIFGGRNTSGNIQGFMGYMSHCAFYTSEVSAARVAAHYTAGGTKITFLNQQWQLLAADSMELSTSASVLSALTQTAAIAMLHSDSSTFTADLLASVQLAVSLATSATITPVLTPQQALKVTFLDSASIAQQLTASKFGQIVLTESAQMLGVLAAGQKVSLNLSDIITAAVIIKAGAEEMVGWIINPNLMASTALDNYDFTGFGQHKGRYYGIRPDGLYVLEGDTDDGGQIDSFISLGNKNFNTAKQKRVPHAYIGASTDGRMVLKVIVHGQEYLYAVRNPSTDMAEQRVDIGRGLRSNYWNFELMNREGADFEIDTIKFMPIVLERRI